MLCLHRPSTQRKPQTKPTSSARLICIGKTTFTNSSLCNSELPGFWAARSHLKNHEKRFVFPFLASISSRIAKRIPFHSCARSLGISPTAKLQLEPLRTSPVSDEMRKNDRFPHRDRSLHLVSMNGAASDSARFGAARRSVCHSGSVGARAPHDRYFLIAF